MKKLLLALTIVAATALTMYGQGKVGFNNYVSGNVVQITSDPLQAAAGQGAPDANVGSTYSIQLLWAVGTLNQAQWDAAVKSSSGAFSFFGTTGGTVATGAGLFDGGVIDVGAEGAYTFQARAWYNGGVNATYNAAALANANIGQSALFNATATSGTAPPGDAFPASFRVAGVVPEPSTLALAGLGAAALLLFRRRK